MYHEPLELRFWSKVKKEKNGCWVWTGAKNAKGYGSIRVDSYSRRFVHVLSYEWYYGEILPGMEIDHSCRNPSCVNPRHLQPVSHAENIRLIWERKPHEPRTHCSKGHELSGDNLTETGGRWRCRTCARQKTAQYRSRQAKNPRPLPSRPVQCANGHVLDDETATIVAGSWRCRLCNRDVTARYRAQFKDAPRELPLPPATCTNGHSMTGENLQRSKTQWFCKTCRNEYQRRSYHKRKAAAAD